MHEGYHRIDKVVRMGFLCTPVLSRKMYSYSNIICRCYNDKFHRLEILTVCDSYRCIKYIRNANCSNTNKYYGSKSVIPEFNIIELLVDRLISVYYNGVTCLQNATCHRHDLQFVYGSLINIT